MGSGPCSVGTAEKQIYSGLHTELPESVQSSCCCKTNQLLQSHFFSGLFLAQGLTAQWSVLSCPGEVLLHCGSSPLLWEYLAGTPAAKAGVCRWGWDAALVWGCSHSWLCWEGLPPPRSAVLVGQTLAAAQS